MAPRVRLQGWAVWGAAVGLTLALPGTLWKPLPPPAFPLETLLPTAGLFLLLVLAALFGARLLGPRAGRSGGLTLMEAPPDFLWGALVLACWPAAAGPPGWMAWGLAFLAAALPGEIRWLGQALPAERPFPSAWGVRVTGQQRALALKTLLPAWLGARFPLWLTGGLVLERILGLQGLGSDWSSRMAVRDRVGMALWILALALLWGLANLRNRKAE